MNISTDKFDGTCDVCDAQAALQPPIGTALIQRIDTGRLAIVNTQKVRCERQHEYYVLDWASQVDDPWLEGENPLEEGVELPPPPGDDEGV